MTHDETLAAVLAQLAEVRAALAEQREINAQQREAISALREEMLLRASSLEAAARLAQPESTVTHDSASAAQPERPGAGRKGTSRRSLLRTAAAGAAAAAVATVAAGNVEQAHAATGANLILGQANDAGATTSLTNSSGSTPTSVLQVSTSVARGSANAAILGSSSGATGVQGSDSGSNGYGVIGTASGQSGTGVWGNASLGFGVLGEGYHGVTGKASSGFDLAASGTGRVFQEFQYKAGYPTGPGPYVPGEYIRDNVGEIWHCIADDGTLPGNWMKMAHLAPGYSVGGAITYLSKPIRLLDTRAGYTDALFHPGAPYTSANPHPLQVAGDVYNGVTVPISLTGPVGAIGNVTVANPTGSGYIAIVPHGAGYTGTAILTYKSKQTVSNSFNVGLGPGGVLDIIIGGASTDVIIDLYAVV